MTTSVKTLSQLANQTDFIARHIGPNATETAAMLAELGVSSVEELIAQTVPAHASGNRRSDYRSGRAGVLKSCGLQKQNVYLIYWYGLPPNAYAECHSA